MHLTGLSYALNRVIVCRGEDTILPYLMFSCNYKRSTTVLLSFSVSVSVSVSILAFVPRRIGLRQWFVLQKLCLFVSKKTWQPQERNIVNSQFELIAWASGGDHSRERIIQQWNDHNEVITPQYFFVLEWYFQLSPPWHSMATFLYYRWVIKRFKLSVIVYWGEGWLQ
jgi:hypothetical protein